jgi:hypothetical protein
MADLKKYYEIEFIYTDNGQIFRTGARMTKDEQDKLLRVLEQFKNAGAIEQQSVTFPSEVEHEYDDVLDEILKALENEVTDGDDVSKCQNCQREWPDSVLINPIPDLMERIAPGEPMPSGECPGCGAVCQPVPKEDGD